MGRTVQEDALQEYSFRVEIEGSTVAAFQKVTGLTAERGETTYAAGGQSYTRKYPGRETIGDVTCTRGLLFPDNQQELRQLYSELDPVKGGVTNFRKQVTIMMLDRYGNEVYGWVLKEAWIKKWEGPSLDGGSDNVAVESIIFSAEEIDDIN